MATKKDLVEAYSFSRRRLVTAFVSGAPGGREVEPNRPGRAIVGGVALAVLVAAGGAVAGILGSHQSVDWTKPALVSDKDTFAYYVILPTGGSDGSDTASDPVLRPVTNVTSAMLLLGPGLTRESVSSSDIASQQRGAPIGILQAPATPPTPDNLLPGNWTACTGIGPDGKPYGTKINVSTAPLVTPDPHAAMVFNTGSKLYVVAEASGGDLPQPRAYAYEVPKNDRTDRVLQDVADGVSKKDALPVTPDLIGLFTPGPALSPSSFDIEGAGTKADYASGFSTSKGHTPKVGDYFSVPDDPDLRVLLQNGVARLGPFAARVYVDTLPSGKGTRLPTQPDDSNRRADPPYDQDLWPDSAQTEKLTGQSCATLETGTGQLPSVRLATAPTGAASAEDVPRLEHDASVDAGHGAVVLSGGWGAADFDPETSQPFLVDDRGFAYPLDGNARDQLGYSDVPDIDVPDTWLKLFNQGVPLSVSAAQCPPTSGEKAKPCGG